MNYWVGICEFIFAIVIFNCTTFILYADIIKPSIVRFLGNGDSI